MTKYAYCTLITKISYLQGAINLYKTLQIANSKYDFVLMITDDIKGEAQQLLSQYPQIIIKSFPKLYFKNDIVFHDETINKFYLWSLIEYEKVMFIDADCIIRYNLDNLFDQFTDNAFTYYKFKNKPQEKLIHAFVFIAIPNQELCDFFLTTQKLGYSGDEAVIQKYIKDYQVIPNNIRNSVLHLHSWPKYWDLLEIDLQKAITDNNYLLEVFKILKLHSNYFEEGLDDFWVTYDDRD